MKNSQIPLFGDEPEELPVSKSLVLIPQADRPLTAAQKAFNRLIEKLEKLRIKLSSESRRLDAGLIYHRKHIRPRLQRQAELRRELVLILAQFLDKSRLKDQRRRKTLKRVVAGQLEALSVSESSEFGEDLQDVFKKIHGIDYKQAAIQGMEEARDFMEDMFEEAGIDIDLSGFDPDMSEEAAAARFAEMEEQIRNQAEQEIPPPNSRRKSKRQTQREERMREAQEVRKKSIGSIYKQLAKVLHPDLEPNAEQRSRKLALMQELTAAYRANDLHTLLRLELEWVQHEQGDIARLTDNKLTIYNEVLREQVNELDKELFFLPRHPRYQSLTDPNSMLDTRVRIPDERDVRRLDQETKDMEFSLQRLRSADALQEVIAIADAFQDAYRTPF